MCAIFKIICHHRCTAASVLLHWAESNVTYLYMVRKQLNRYEDHVISEQLVVH